MTGTTQADDSGSSGGRLKSLGRRLWNTRTRRASVIALPSLAGALCAFVLEASEGSVPELRSRREALERDAAAYESLARDFEAYELQRAAQGINLAAADAPMQSRYLADTLYRLKALTGLRRFLVDRPTPTLAPLLADYDREANNPSQERARIDRLQEIETGIILGALGARRDAQFASSAALEEIDKRERWNKLLGDFIKYLGYVGSIIAFFAKTGD